MKPKLAIFLGLVLTTALFTPRTASAQQLIAGASCVLSGNDANCPIDLARISNAQQHAFTSAADPRAGVAPDGVEARAFSKSRVKFCAENPGKDWHYFSMSDGQLLSAGHCLSDDEKAAAAANAFVTHHKEFVRSQQNSEVLTAYCDTHNLDPRDEKSYERAYKDLRKSKKLALNAD
jgi:hypothetical protein